MSGVRCKASNTAAGLTGNEIRSISTSGTKANCMWKIRRVSNYTSLFHKVNDNDEIYVCSQMHALQYLTYTQISKYRRPPQAAI